MHDQLFSFDTNSPIQEDQEENLPQQQYYYHYHNQRYISAQQDKNKNKRKSIIHFFYKGLDRLFRHKKKGKESRQESNSIASLPQSFSPTKPIDTNPSFDDHSPASTNDKEEKFTAFQRQNSEYISNQFKNFFSAKSENAYKQSDTQLKKQPKDTINSLLEYPWLPPESWAIVQKDDRDSPKKSISSRLLDPNHLDHLKFQLRDESFDMYDSSPKIVSSSVISLPLSVDGHIKAQLLSSSTANYPISKSSSSVFISKNKNDINTITEVTASDHDPFVSQNSIWWIRVWKPLRRGSIPCSLSSQSSVSSKDLLSFSTLPFVYVTVSCPLDIDTKGLISLVSAKLSNSSLPYTSEQFSIFPQELYVIHKGIARILHSNDKPVLLQKKWFEQMGFTGLSTLSNLGLQDHSYLCQFIYFDSGDASNCLTWLANESHNIGSNIFPDEYELSATKALLIARNLQVFPVKIFQYASTLEVLDFSRNLMIFIPSDFIQSCHRLKQVALNSCELDMIPRSIPFCFTLTHLNLRNNLLKEDALDCLCLLKNLEILDLTANHLSYLPLSLVSLSKLKELYLSSNGITTLPSVLFHMKSIEILDLSFNFITILQEEISSLANLKTLILAYNRIRTLGYYISTLSRLETVDIRGNNISDISMLLVSKSLISINAQYNSIARINFLNLGPCISRLNLDNNSLSSIDIPPVLSGGFISFHCITELLICSSKLVSIPDSLFINCPNLIKLRIDNNQLKEIPSSIRYLSNTLTSLTVSNNKLTSLPESIGMLKKLVILDIHGNNISSLSMSLLSCSQLSFINISSNLLTLLPVIPFINIESMDSIARPKLQYFNASDNQLQDDSLGFILYFDKLISLNISHNRFFDVNLIFTHLFKLKALIASGNEISSVSEDIANCQHLEYLYLNDNRLSTLPAEIGKLSNLVAIDVSDNYLRYNINNWPYDWHWQWNTELIYLNVSGNNRFELYSPSHEMPESNITNINDSTSSIVSDFKSLSKLEFLDLSNIKGIPDVLPSESFSLKVRNLFNAEQNIQHFPTGIEVHTPSTNISSISFDKSPKKIPILNYFNQLKEKKSPRMLLNFTEPLFSISNHSEDDSLGLSLDTLPSPQKSYYSPISYGISTTLPIRVDYDGVGISSSYSNCSIHDLVDSKLLLDITEKQDRNGITSTNPSRNRKVNHLWEFVNFSFLSERDGYRNILIGLFDDHYNGEAAFFLYKSFSDSYFAELKSFKLKKTESILSPSCFLKEEPIRRRNSITSTIKNTKFDANMIIHPSSSSTLSTESASQISFGNDSIEINKEDIYFDPDDLNCEALKRTFLNLNRDLYALKISSGSGCTALVVHISHHRLFVANSGDSLAVLNRSGHALVLSKIHTGFNRSERARVRSAGGFVTTDKGLVDGIAPLARSFGYFDLCPSITADPSIHIVDITQFDDFLILANSELWSWIDPQTAVDIASSTGGNLKLAANKLRDIAVGYGSTGAINIQIISLNVQQLSASSLTLCPIFGSERSLKNRSFHYSSSSSLFNLRKINNLESQLYHNKDNTICAKESFVFGPSGSTVMDSSLARLKTEIAPPTGNVAIVFTDIRSSTLLWELIPSAMESAIKVHNSILRRLLRTVGGYEAKTDGDAFMAAFPDPLLALKWCLYGQIQLLQADWPQELLECPEGQPVYLDTDTLNYNSEALECNLENNVCPRRPIYRGLSVRMGIHYGTPICELDPITQRMDYFGVIVNRASRITGVAHGGQICISAEIYDEYMRSVSSEATLEASLLYPKFFSLGPVRLKGLEATETIYSVYTESLVCRRDVVKQSSELSTSTEQLKNVHDITRRLEAIASFMFNDSIVPQS